MPILKGTKRPPYHIISLARGGSNWIENIQPLCSKCNYRKWAKFKNKKVDLLK